MLHKTHAHQAAPETKGRLIRWGASYDFLANLLFLGRAQGFRNTTADLAHLKQGQHVLEVGCGTGALTLVAKTRVGTAGKVVGIDPAPEMIEVARQKATRMGQDIDFQIGLIEHLSFPDASFDVVLSSLMMHHLPKDVKAQGFAEIYRVLKPGGHLLVVDIKHATSPLGRAALTLLMHHGLSSGVQDLPDKAKQAGFRYVETGDTHYAVLGFVRAEK